MLFSRFTLKRNSKFFNDNSAATLLLISRVVTVAVMGMTLSVLCFRPKPYHLLLYRCSVLLSLYQFSVFSRRHPHLSPYIDTHTHLIQLTAVPFLACVQFACLAASEMEIKKFISRPTILILNLHNKQDAGSIPTSQSSIQTRLDPIRTY